MMKGWKIQSIIWTVLIGILLVYFGYDLYHYNQHDKKADVRFTFICPLQWRNAGKAFYRLDADYGTSTRLVGFSRLSPQGMEEAFREAIYAEVDGIITAGIQDSSGLSQLIREAAEEGIPVALIDSDLPESRRSVYIGPDNYKAGYEAGKLLAAKVLEENPEGALGVILSKESILNQRERLQGFRDAVRETEGIRIAEVAEGFSDRQVIIERLESMLRAHPDLNGLFLAEGWSTVITGEILSRHADRKISVVGYDAYSYVRDGSYEGVVDSNLYEQAFLAGEKLLKLLSGEEIEETVLLESELITQENLDAYLNQMDDREEKEEIWHIY